MAFDPASGTSGISFHTGGNQNSNTAYVSFLGPTIGDVFGFKGMSGSYLKSGHSFAQRQTLAPAPDIRYAFSVNDASFAHFGFYTYTSGGHLIFAYTTRAVTSYYTVPDGQEDAIFGAGVVTQIWGPPGPATRARYTSTGKRWPRRAFAPRTPTWTRHFVLYDRSEWRGAIRRMEVLCL